MSSFEPNRPNTAKRFRRAALAGIIGLLALSSACTVRPLYSNAPLSAGSTVGARAEMASIAVKPVKSRYAQQVRNHLIYGLTGGGGEPANPAYSLDLAVSETVESSAVVQVTREIDEPTSGTVTMAGEDITGLPPHELFAKGLLRTFQIAREFSSMSVLENLMMVPGGQSGERLLHTWTGRRGIAREEERLRARAEDVLDFLTLTHLRDERAGSLSGGQKKLLELGRTMMVDARIVFLDEQKAKRENRPVADVTAESTGSIPVGRYGDPKEYGDTVAFLASPRASYITGSVIRIDGGLIGSI